MKSGCEVSTVLREGVRRSSNGKEVWVFYHVSSAQFFTASMKKRS
jgi:hypothetical protein